jgi:hypothetical protein
LYLVRTATGHFEPIHTLIVHKGFAKDSINPTTSKRVDVTKDMAPRTVLAISFERDGSDEFIGTDEHPIFCLQPDYDTKEDNVPEKLMTRLKLNLQQVGFKSAKCLSVGDWIGAPIARQDRKSQFPNYSSDTLAHFLVLLFAISVSLIYLIFFFCSLI